MITLIWIAGLFLICLICGQEVKAGPVVPRSATSGHSDPKIASISSFLAGGQYVLLTFSNGPHKRLTSQILDILKEHNIHATFFVYGQRALTHGHLVQRMVREGHEVGQQGFFAGTLSSNQIDSINSTAYELERLTGQRILYFRPPRGSSSDIIPALHGRTGMKSILWSIDVSDKIGKNPSNYPAVEDVIPWIVKDVKPGSIIQAHDTHPLWVSILPVLLKTLTDQGYEFVTVSQMMSFPDDAPH